MFAVEGEVGAREPRALAWDIDVDGPVTIAAGSSWLATEALKSQIAPASCAWCETNAVDRSVREGWRWSDPHAAEVTSNAIGYAAGPVLVLGANTLAAVHDGSLRAAFIDTILIVEAALLASDVNQLFKFTVARERPWAVDVPYPATRDAHLSFFSGHTTLAFSVATAAGTVATMRGYRWAPLVWAVGVPYAFATGYLRIAADQHWLTDVLVGAVTGVAFGFAIPFFFHRPLPILAGMRWVPMGAGAAIVGGF